LPDATVLYIPRGHPLACQRLAQVPAVLEVIRRLPEAPMKEYHERKPARPLGNPQVPELGGKRAVGQAMRRSKRRAGQDDRTHHSSHLGPVVANSIREYTLAKYAE